MKRLLFATTTFFAIAFITGCSFVERKKTESQNTEAGSSIAPTPEKHEVRFALSDTVTTLDPRKVQGMASSCLTQLLFEGLTRLDDQGKILPGVAANIHVSPDMKTYTFSLREGKWSNGDPITASDFEHSWKSQLTPETKATANHLLFVIKSAKAAFEGKIPLEQVGISCPDDKTLVVTLENPTPYFLQLAATPTYLPVNQKWTDEEADQHTYITNGQFTLNSWKPHEAIDLKKNDLHPGASKQKFTDAHFAIVNSQTATAMYQKEELDWIGSPLVHLSKEDSEKLQAAEKRKVAPTAGTFFLRINTEWGPFSNLKMRRAFCLSIDREAILKATMKEATAATSFVPPSLGLPYNYFTLHDLPHAKALFEEALGELHITKEQLPQIRFCFTSSPSLKKIAEVLQMSWKEAFGVEVILEDSASSIFYDKILSKDYVLASGSWLADYFDPMSFLSIFQYKENGTNNTQWSNNKYTELLEQSSIEMDHQKRFEILRHAQDILMEEMPIMPILHFPYVYANSQKLDQAKLLPMGTLEF